MYVYLIFFHLKLIHKFSSKLTFLIRRKNFAVMDENDCKINTHII